MNSIAGFLTSLLPRPPGESYGAGSDSETSANSADSKGNGFDAVLSGLSQNPTSDDPTMASAAPPVRSVMAPMTGEDAGMTAATSSTGHVSDSAAIEKSAVAGTDVSGFVPTNAKIGSDAAPSAAASPSLDAQAATLSGVTSHAPPYGVLSSYASGGASTGATASAAAARLGGTDAADTGASAAVRPLSNGAKNPPAGAISDNDLAPNSQASSGLSAANAAGSGPAGANAGAVLPSLQIKGAMISPAGGTNGDDQALNNLSAATGIAVVSSAGNASVPIVTASPSDSAKTAPAGRVSGAHQASNNQGSSNLAATSAGVSVPTAGVAKTPPASGMNGNAPTLSNLSAASGITSAGVARDALSTEIAAIATGGINEPTASSSTRTDITVGSATAANGVAMPTTADAAAAIAASLQSVMPSIQNAEADAPKASWSDGPGRPASASAAKSAGSTAGAPAGRAEGTDPATANAALTDPAAQAAFAAAVAPDYVSAPLLPNSDNAANLGLSSLHTQVQSHAIANGGGVSGSNGGNVDLASLSSTAAIRPNSAADASEMKVTVLSSATYFAPVARLSPVQQIADAVIGAASNLSPGLSGSAASGPPMAADATTLAFGAAGPDPTALPQSAASPIKTLNLQLEPENLGTVTISLNLSGSGLDVQMAASQLSTMNLIEKDKDALSNQLRDSGYTVAGVAVTLGASDGSQVANHESATQGQSGAAFSQGGSQAMSQGGSSNGNDNAQNGAERSPQVPLGGVATDSLAGVAPGGGLPGDLYI
jgi:hypothetical protein